MKQLHLSIYILFVVSATVVLLNRFTPLYIMDYRVHFIFLLFAAFSFVIIVGHLFNTMKSGKSILFTFIIVASLCLLKSFFTWGGDWKTQTILYRNIADKSQTIDYQMRGDRFAFGYKKRIICKSALLPFFAWMTDIDTLKIDKSKWTKVNLEVNELNLPNEH